MDGNDLKVFELHLREGQGDYAGCGYYFMIGRAGETPSWYAIQHFIKHLFPEENQNNPIHPFYLDLYGKSLESEGCSNLKQLLQGLTTKEKDRIQSMLEEPHTSYYLIWEGISMDPEEGSFLRNAAKSIIAIRDNYDSTCMEEIV